MSKIDTPDSLTADQANAKLKELGLPTGTDSLGTVTHKPRKQPVLAPQGIDPHTMDVESIVFDPVLLDEFPSLEGGGMAAANRHIFALYQSYGRNTDRNSHLHRRISQFITHVRRSRETGGMIKEKVKTSKKDRDLAALLASQDVTQSDLAEALTLLAEKRAKKEES